MLKSFVFLVILSANVYNFCFSQTITDDPSFRYTSALADPTGQIGCALKQENKSQLIFKGGANGIVKIDSLGRVMSSYQSGYFQYSNAISVDGILETSDSKIVFYGYFLGYQGHSSRSIVRASSTGNLDATFTSPLTTTTLYVENVTELPSGKYICSVIDQSANTSILVLNNDGSIDPSFVSPYPISNLQNIAKFIALSDGSILIVFETYIQKMSANGTIDNSFNSAPVGFTGLYGYSDADLLDDGKMLFLSNNKVYRLLSDGTIDNTFTTVNITTSTFYAKKIVKSVDNKFYVYGRRGAGSAPSTLIRRYSLNGVLDNTFNLAQGFNNDTPGILQINSLTAFDDGTLSIHGSFDDLNDVTATNAMLMDNLGNPIWMHKTGSALNSYSAFTIHVDVAENIFIGGDFTSYNGSVRNDITKLTKYGHTDYSFKPGTGFVGRVNDIVTQPDGKIVVCGQFTSYNGTAVNRIVRLNSNGTIDNTFNTGAGFSGGASQLNTIGLQSDGKIIVAGDLSYYNGSPISRIIRLLPNGSLDLSFTPAGPNAEVLDLIVRSNDELLICGEFSSCGGTSRSRIALLNSSGTLNTDFVPANPYGSGDIRSMAIQPDGKIVVGGNFHSYTDNIDRRLGRLNPDGSADLTFIPNAMNYNFPEAIGILADGNIVVGCGTISVLLPNGTSVAYDNLTLNTGVMDIYVNPVGNPILVGQFTLSNYKYGISRLKMVPAIHHTDVIQSCQSYTWIDGNTYTSSTSVPTFTFTDQYGVDSIVHLDLDIQSNSVVDHQISCEPLTWLDGFTYLESTNSPAVHYTNINGCDSMVTLNFTRFQPDSAIDVREECNSFTWINGITYTQSVSNITHTLSNALGCDSVIALNLTMNHFESELDYNGFGTLTSLNGYTIAWINCDDNTVIPGVNSNSFQPSENGSYAVIASNNICSDTSDCYIVTNLGVNSNMLDHVSVYPNPSTNGIHFSFNSNEVGTLTILTVLGSRVQELNITNDQFVSTEDLPSGLYIYELRVGSSRYSGRFEKMKNK